MGFYLLDNPNPHGPHYYTTRRGKVKAYVLHITAGLEDQDTIGDHSAENTARYAATTDRPVSWHVGSDADSAFRLLPASYTAFQVKGYNSSTYGHEISKKHTDWNAMSPEWVEKTLTQAASVAGPEAKALGIPFRKATKAELDHAIATDGPPVGFIYHWELDPDRRSDPGLHRGADTFPMTRFLDKCKAAVGGTPTTPTQEEFLMDAEVQQAFQELANGIIQTKGVVDELKKEVINPLGPEGDSRMDRLSKMPGQLDGIQQTLDAILQELKS
jgi:hypothetical protein